MTSISLPSVPLEGGLSQYFREAWAFPMLDPDQEYMLAQRWREHGDVDAAHQLVTSHLRLVCKIAAGYKGYGLPLADLISEGNIGLMKAVKKFEPERGFRLSTYAMWWIRAAITEFVLRSWSMVKIGTVAAQKKLFFSLRKVKGQLKIMDTGELTPDQSESLSLALDVPTGDVIAMNRRLASRDVSLNAPIGDEDSLEFQDTLMDEAPSPEEFVASGEELSARRKYLKSALKTLSDRERHIFMERQLKDDPQTLEELGQHYGISRERIRQLEVRAFEKVKAAVTQEAVAAGA
ncbi:MAG: RNA polymerase sigma factor RpoH [Rhodospirillales bacterium]